MQIYAGWGAAPSPSSGRVSTRVMSPKGRACSAQRRPPLIISSTARNSTTISVRVSQAARSFRKARRPPGGSRARASSAHLLLQVPQDLGGVAEALVLLHHAGELRGHIPLVAEQLLLRR